MLSTLRQWLHPREFRIAAIDLPAVLSAFAERMAQHERTQAATQSKVRPAQSDGAADDRLLADVGTGWWRLRGRMVDPSTGEPPEEMRRAFRHAEAIGDALAAAGIRIQDHTGIDFDPGLSLKVLAYQPVSGMPRERVIETIKPTIYRNDVRIQMGEVIVGTPDVPGEPDAARSPA